MYAGLDEVGRFSKIKISLVPRYVKIVHVMRNSLAPFKYSNTKVNGKTVCCISELHDFAIVSDLLWYHMVHGMGDHGMGALPP